MTRLEHRRQPHRDVGGHHRRILREHDPRAGDGRRHEGLDRPAASLLCKEAIVIGGTSRKSTDRGEPCSRRTLQRRLVAELLTRVANDRPAGRNASPGRGEKPDDTHASGVRRTRRARACRWARSSSWVRFPADPRPLPRQARRSARRRAPRGSSSRVASRTKIPAVTSGPACSAVRDVGPRRASCPRTADRPTPSRWCCWAAGVTFAIPSPAQRSKGGVDTAAHDDEEPRRPALRGELLHGTGGDELASRDDDHAATARLDLAQDVVESNTVCSFPSSRMTSRTSRIWFGSSPPWARRGREAWLSHERIREPPRWRYPSTGADHEFATSRTSPCPSRPTLRSCDLRSERASARRGTGVLGHPHLRIERHGFGHVAELLTCREALRADVVPVDLHRTRVAEKARDDP